ncbi:PTS system fructose-specific IIB /IIC component [Photobacterium aphoticum]|uniref:protein-N(pi)-phosphohistidine--D-fructose phosphotransferase n=1 Tax=Photobacterium aphoticum TaxID=754436 RepID=A0A090QZ12_9GAMM|nr:PTS system fructose-specific IIB /IIC component [Photobacterium aphoticum]
MKIAVVTACPSGIANSVIAAGLIEKAAADLKWEVSIECQSSVMSVKTLTDAQIAEADVVIVAADKAVDLSRFADKRVYQSAVAACFGDPKAFLENATANADVLSAAQLAATAQTASVAGVETEGGVKRIVAITACPTGVAHTFMAAEALEEEGQRQGHQIKVETRGSVGAKNQLTAEEIAAADLVIIAADIEVDLSRFNGKKLYKTSTGLALKKTTDEMEKAFATATVYQHQAGAQTEQKQEKTGAYKHLMTGVSHMLPLVVAGGLSIALSFVFGIEAFKEEGTLLPR